MNVARPLFAALGIAAGICSTAASAFDPDAVRHEVDEMNQSLPAMVSPKLREEPIRFTGDALLYTFTHVDRAPDEVDRLNLSVTARAYLLKQLCGDPDTRQMMHEGLSFSFAYVDGAHTHTDGANITDQDCVARGAKR